MKYSCFISYRRHEEVKNFMVKLKKIIEPQAFSVTNMQNAFFDEKNALKFSKNPILETISKKVINSRNDLIKIFKEANNLLRKEGLLAGHERFSVFSNVLKNFFGRPRPAKAM